MYISSGFRRTHPSTQTGRNECIFLPKLKFSLRVGSDLGESFVLWSRCYLPATFLGGRFWTRCAVACGAPLRPGFLCSFEEGVGKGEKLLHRAPRIRGCPQARGDRPLPGRREGRCPLPGPRLPWARMRGSRSCPAGFGAQSRSWEELLHCSAPGPAPVGGDATVPRPGRCSWWGCLAHRGAPSAERGVRSEGASQPSPGPVCPGCELALLRRQSHS